MEIMNLKDHRQVVLNDIEKLKMENIFIIKFIIKEILNYGCNT